MRQAELMGSGALALAVAEAVAVAVVDDAHRLRPPLRPARRPTAGGESQMSAPQSTRQRLRLSTYPSM